jgi:hypothetical protein
LILSPPLFLLFLLYSLLLSLGTLLLSFPLLLLVGGTTFLFLLLLSGFLGLGSGGGSAIITTIIASPIVTTDTQDLLDMLSGVDLRSGCLEHGLEEGVGFFGLLAGHDFGWLHIDFLPDYKLSQLDHFDQEIKFCIFLSNGFGI